MIFHLVSYNNQKCYLKSARLLNIKCKENRNITSFPLSRVFIVHLRQLEKANINLEGCLILKHFPVFCITRSIEKLFQLCVITLSWSWTLAISWTSVLRYGEESQWVLMKDLYFKKDGIMCFWNKGRRMYFKGILFRTLLCALGSRVRGKKWWQEYILKSGHCKLVLDFWAFRMFVQEVVSKVLQLC